MSQGRNIMSQGRNVKRLIATRMASIMIPLGTKKGEGLATGIAALMKPGNIGAVAKEAAEWVREAIAAVKSAPDNPWGDDDEAIAGAILEKVESQLTEKCNAR